MTCLHRPMVIIAYQRHSRQLAPPDITPCHRPLIDINCSVIIVLLDNLRQLMRAARIYYYVIAALARHDNEIDGTKLNYLSFNAIR